MSSDTKELLEEALRLPRNERLRLAERLLATFSRHQFSALLISRSARRVTLTGRGSLTPRRAGLSRSRRRSRIGPIGRRTSRPPFPKSQNRRTADSSPATNSTAGISAAGRIGLQRHRWSTSRRQSGLLTDRRQQFFFPHPITARKCRDGCGCRAPERHGKKQYASLSDADVATPFLPNPVPAAR